MIEGNDESTRRIVTIYDDIYDRPDARAYYRAMDAAGFRTAHHAADGFAAALSAVRARRGGGACKILDFASGYGIAAALLRHDLTLDDVLARYRDPWFDAATPPEVITADARWYRARRIDRQNDVHVGIDVAGNALAYARSVGIFDAVFPENLQADTMSDALCDAMADCDLIVECGSVAHLLPLALDRLLQAAPGPKPWIVTAPIRGNDSAAAFDVMRRHGLHVDGMGDRPFRHRRFADSAEQARAIENAAARGHDTAGIESNGFFHAQLYLARPVSETGAVPGWTLRPVA